MRKSVKKILSGLFALLMCAAMPACGNTDKQKPPYGENNPPDKTEVTDLTEYDGEKYLQPFWSGNHVYAETAMLLKDQTGKLPAVQLYYPATEIVAVRNFALDRLYEDGTDYILEDGKLKIPDESALYAMACDYDLFYQPVFIDGVNWAQVSGGAQLRTEAEAATFSAGLTQYQIAVTYRHESEYGATAPKDKSALMPRTNEKLDLGEELRVVCLGDSISAGWSASGYELVNRKPFMPPYFTQTVNRLKERNLQVRSANLSVGGKTSDWGMNAQNISDVTSKKPDLVIVGFGMNDGADKNYVPATYKRNIQSIINKVRAVCPNAEFLLVATMLPNAEVGYVPGVSILQNQDKYLDALEELESEYEGVAVADVTSVSKELLSRKAFRDMSANNINHPNDFMQRIYAQTVLTALIGNC